jgi:hypothetical protein
MSAISVAERMRKEREELRRKQIVAGIVEDSPMKKRFKELKKKQMLDFKQQTQVQRAKVNINPAQHSIGQWSIAGRIIGKSSTLSPSAQGRWQSGGVTTRISRRGPMYGSPKVEIKSGSSQQETPEATWTTSGYLTQSNPDFDVQSKRTAPGRMTLGMPNWRTDVGKSSTIGSEDYGAGAVDAGTGASEGNTSQYLRRKARKQGAIGGR